MDVDRREHRVLQGRRVLEGRAVLEPVLRRPTVAVHDVEQAVDVGSAGRARRHRRSALGHHRCAGSSCLDVRRPGLSDLEEAVVDRRALDVEQVDAVVLRKHLEGRVGEADADRQRHLVITPSSLAGRRPPSARPPARHARWYRAGVRPGRASPPWGSVREGRRHRRGRLHRRPTSVASCSRGPRSTRSSPSTTCPPAPAPTSTAPASGCSRGRSSTPTRSTPPATAPTPSCTSPPCPRSPARSSTLSPPTTPTRPARSRCSRPPAAAGDLHVVVASSSSVYGANRELPKREGMRTAPISPYAVSKQATEAYAMSFGHTYGLPVLAFRFFNVYGPLQPAGPRVRGGGPGLRRRRPARRCPSRSTATASRPATSPTSARSTRVLTDAVTAQGHRPRAGEPRVRQPNLPQRARRRPRRHPRLRPAGRARRATRAGDVRDSQADNERLRRHFPDVDPGAAARGPAGRPSTGSGPFPTTGRSPCDISSTHWGDPTRGTRCCSSLWIVWAGAAALALRSPPSAHLAVRRGPVRARRRSGPGSTSAWACKTDGRSGSTAAARHPDALSGVGFTCCPPRRRSGYANANAALAVQVIGLCGLAFLGADRTGRRVLGAAVGFSIVGILANASTGALAVTVPLLALIGVAVWGPVRRRRWMVLGGATAALLVAAQVVRLAGLAEWPRWADLGIDSTRRSLWGDAKSLWSQHPLVGSGPGSFAALQPLGHRP